MATLYLYLYRFLVIPVFLFSFLILSLFARKFKQGLKIRLSRKFRPPYPKNSKNCQPIWFHCSSGEFEYARPVIREIKFRDPQQKILVTFYSPSFLKSIQNEPLVDHCYPLPLDTPSAVSGFIKHFNPKKILFARTDLWPELLYQAKKRNIPLCLFSRTEKQIGFNPFKKMVYSFLYNQLCQIFFASQQDHSNYLQAFSNLKTKTSVSGDTRYDQVIYKTAKLKQLPDQKTFTCSKFCLVLGSVWPKDLNVVLAPAFNLFNQGKIGLIIAPHEFDERFETLIKKYQKHLQYFSQGLPWDSNKILIVDKFGVLFETYQAANLSFIGGSFKKNVHSVMEPLACGSPVIVGPKNHNNREAQDFKHKFIGRNHPMVSEVNSQKSFTTVVEKLMSLDITQQQIKDTISKEVIAKSGASHEVTSWTLS